MLCCCKLFSLYFFFIKERCEVYHKQQQICNPHRQVFNESTLAYKYKQTKHKQKYCNKNDGCNYVLLVFLSAFVQQEYYNAERTEESEDKCSCPVTNATGSGNNLKAGRGKIDSKVNSSTAK